MAVLSTVFDFTDRMSAKLEALAAKGNQLIDNWESAGTTADTAFGTATERATQTAQAIDELGTATSDLTKNTEAYNDENIRGASTVDSFSDGIDEAAEAVKEYSDNVERADQSTNQFGDGMDDAGKSADAFGKETTDAVNAIDKVLTAAGIAKAVQEIYEAFEESIKAAIEFESAITGVRKTVDGTDEQLAAISDEIKAMSVSMPATTTEIAAVAEAAGQLGIATENITEFSQVMIDLGEATNLSSDVAASSLAKFANVTQMSADQYDNLGSTIVALGNNFATTEADIVAMATNMASAGSLAGLTEPEILALATSLSSVGVEAQAGGSAMARMLTSMQVAVETGNEQLDQFAYVAGMTSEEFSKAWGDNAVNALYTFIAGLNDTERTGSTATVMLEEMGITEIRLSNAIKALASDNEGLNSAIGLANQAWEENTALTTEASTRYATLESNLAMTENASNNLNVAIGDVFTPTLSKASVAWRSILLDMTGFVEENPTVVRAVAAVTAGVVAFTVAIAGYSAVTMVAKVATTALTAAMEANPAILVATAVIAVTTALVAFIATADEAEDEYNTLTAASKDQYDTLQELNAEYDRAVEMYGAASYEAQRLRWEIEDLDAEYQSSKQTMEEWIAASQALSKSNSDLISSYQESVEKIDTESQSVIALANKLEELSSKTSRTAEDKEAMLAIIDRLNEAMPELALSYDGVTKSFSGTADSIRTIAQAEADRRRYQTDYEAYVELVGKEAELSDNLAKAQDGATLAQEQYNDAKQIYFDKLYGYDNSDWIIKDDGEKMEAAKASLESYNAVIEAHTHDLEANRQEQEKILESMAGYTAATEAAETATVDYATAVNKSITSVSDDLNDLISKYDEAYQAARTSIDGTIGLFDSMKTETELSVNDMLKALESQVSYLETYSENLKKAAEYGLDNGLIASLSDGSEESAGYINAIIENIERLNGSTDGISSEAQGFVDKFNEAFSGTEEAKDEFATVAAEMQTNFSTTLDGIEGRMEDAIDNMTMETEAATAAKETIQAYVDQIQSMTGQAHSAAKGVASAAASALSGISLAGIPGYANGTTNAPDVMMTGEDGPELIIGAGGSTVFPADETQKIVAAVNNSPLSIQAPSGVNLSDGESYGSSGSEKKIVLEIAGSGEIKVDSSINKESILDMMMANIRPILMNVLQQEILEEGDLSYDF